MPKEFIYETAITIDHEENVMHVDTTVTSMATAALRAGLSETTQPNSKPYRRFRGAADQVRFRRPKGQHALRGAAARSVSKLASENVAGRKTEEEDQSV